MNPAISKFPSGQFYRHKLKDDPSVISRMREPSFLESPISHIHKHFQPLQFFNINNSIEENRESSRANIKEAKFVINILNKFEILINEKINDSNNQAKG